MWENVVKWKSNKYIVVTSSCVMDQKRSDRVSIQRGVGFLCNGSEKIRQVLHTAWCRILV